MAGETLLDLARRVEALEGPDREVDARLCHVFERRGIFIDWGDDCGRFKPEVVDRWGDPEWAEAGRHLGKGHVPYTASLDTSMALMAEKLPGWCLDTLGDDASGEIGKLKILGATAEVTDGMRGIQGQAGTRPLALLAAILKALATQESSDG